MIVLPRVQRLLYGTVVAIGVSTGGALWYDRANVHKPNLDDYIEVFQSALEKGIATQYSASVTNIPSVVYTNLLTTWVTDADHSWYDYSSGTAVETPYYKKNGTTEYLVTNEFQGKTFRTVYLGSSVLPTAADEMAGSTNAMYLWNAYSNLTASGFVSIPQINGVYALQTNGYDAALAAIIFGYELDDYVGDFKIYQNTTSSYWLLDLGPKDSIKQYAISCGIYDGDIEVAHTVRGDSPINGPWFAPAFKETNATVVGSGFASNLLTDAYCRWWINRTQPSIPQTPALLNTRDLDNYQGYVAMITAESGKPLLEGIDNWIISSLAVPASRYLPSGTDIAGYTNYTQITATNAYMTYSNICALAGVSTNHVYPAIAQVTNVARLAMILQEFDTTVYGCYSGSGNAPPLWGNGYLDDLATFNPRIWRGVGSSTNTAGGSWAEAKSRAYANLSVTTYATNAGFNALQMYVSGQFRTNVAQKFWICDIWYSDSEFAAIGLNTNISKTANFYLQASPAGPIVATNLFDDFGLGLTEGQFSLFDSINSSDRITKTRINIDPATDLVYPDDPEGAPFFSSSQVQSWSKGFSVGSSPVPGCEIILDWAWNYNTNSL